MIFRIIKRSNGDIVHQAMPSDGTAPLCACQCGERVNKNKQTGKWYKHINGHQRRKYDPIEVAKIKAAGPPDCECKCGGKTKWDDKAKKYNKYIKGHECVGRKWGPRSKEHRENLSKSQKGKIISEESKRKMSLAHKGVKRGPHSEEHKRNLSKANKGRVVSKETREKISKGNKGKTHTKKHKEKMSKIQIKRIQENPSNLVTSGYKHGHFYSKKNKKRLRYRSSWELIAYKMLEQMSEIICYESEPFSISYKYEDVEKNYLPDLLITYKSLKKELIEIKPSSRLKEPQNKAKFRAAKRYCKKNDMIWDIWTEKHLEIN